MGLKNFENKDLKLMFYVRRYQKLYLASNHKTETSSGNYRHKTLSVKNYSWSISTVAVVVQLLSHIRLFVTPWTAAPQAPLSSTIFRSLLKFIFIGSVMLSNHLILCHHLFLPSSIFQVFSNELVFCIRWPEYWSFSFCISTVVSS